MYRNRPNACLLENARSRHGVDRVAVPPESYFCGYGCRGGSLHYRFCYLLQKRAISEKRSAAVPANDLVHRASEVQVDKIRLRPIEDRAGGFCHSIGLGAKELDADRPFHTDKANHFPGSLVASENSLGGHKFGDEDIRTLLFAQASEDRVSYPGHRRQI